MTEAEHEAVIELMPAYALGSLDEDEAGLVARHLASCAVCQVELKEYEAVADALPLAVAVMDPPPALKDRLMAQIDTSPLAERPAADEGVQQLSWWTTTANTLREWFGVSAWRPVLAGGLVLIIVALTLGNILQYQESRPSIPAWRRAILTGSELAPEARGIIYISPDGKNGTIVVDGLPDLEPDQQYQLWLILDGQRDSGAVFSVNADGYRGLEIEAPIPLRDYSAFGVTIEPAGGSPGPTGQRVLGFNL